MKIFELHLLIVNGSFKKPIIPITHTSILLYKQIIDFTIERKPLMKETFKNLLQRM